MSNLTNKRWWIAAGIRAIRTTCQSLASMLPAGFVITPVMVQQADWSLVYVVIAWLATGFFAGFTSLLTSLAGLPEVEESEG